MLNLMYFVRLSLKGELEDCVSLLCFINETPSIVTRICFALQGFGDYHAEESLAG